MKMSVEISRAANSLASIWLMAQYEKLRNADRGPQTRISASTMVVKKPVSKSTAVREGTSTEYITCILWYQGCTIQCNKQVEQVIAGIVGCCAHVLIEV
jgi:hypothetical protein